MKKNLCTAFFGVSLVATTMIASEHAALLSTITKDRPIVIAIECLKAKDSQLKSQENRIAALLKKQARGHWKLIKTNILKKRKVRTLVNLSVAHNQQIQLNVAIQTQLQQTKIDFAQTSKATAVQLQQEQARKHELQERLVQSQATLVQTNNDRAAEADRARVNYQELCNQLNQKTRDHAQATNTSTTQLQQLREQLTQRQAAHAETERHLQAQLQQVQASLTQANATSTTQVKTAQANYQELLNQLNQKKAQHTQVAQQLQQIQASLTQANATSTAQAKTAHANYQELLKQLNQKKAEYDKVTQQFNTLKTDILEHMNYCKTHISKTMNPRSKVFTMNGAFLALYRIARGLHPNTETFNEILAQYHASPQNYAAANFFQEVRPAGYDPDHN